MDEERDLAPDELVFRRGAMCRLSKPPAEFHRSRTGQFAYCRECRCAYDRRYYAERGKTARLARQRAHGDNERAWMDSLKRGIPCKDCGEIFPPHVMHWHHLPGRMKLDEIGSMVGSRRREAILAEIEKCELVCANCHVMRTVVRARRSSTEDIAEYRFGIAI
jgi:hypothetical protein